MAYKSLRIIGYEDYKGVANEYKNRLNSPSTINTELDIYPYSVKQQKRMHKQKYPLFCMLLPEIYVKTENIYLKSDLIGDKLAKLPPIALEKLLHSEIVEEIQSTNDIEGVKSTRKEINQAINKKEERFSGIVQMYLDVYQKKIIKITESSDFRKIYDELVLNEIEEKDLPDGNLFRTEAVYVTDGGKNVHQGNLTEESIEADLGKLIQFMNDKSYPILIKALFTHYFFEYVHPFYDGNVPSRHLLRTA